MLDDTPVDGAAAIVAGAAEKSQRRGVAILGGGTKEAMGMNRPGCGVDSSLATNPNTRTSADEVPAFLRTIHRAIADLQSSVEPVVEITPAYTPAVTARKSLSSKDPVPMIDGKPYKTLKMHLSTHGLTPAGEAVLRESVACLDARDHRAECRPCPCALANERRFSSNVV